MAEITIRQAIEADFDAIVALNLAEVSHTSAMGRARLAALHGMANYHKVATADGVVAAFLLAMKHDCGYVNENFGWFSARFVTFLYIDRIVVDKGHRGLGLGSLLYEDLFDHARAIGIPAITCEYNVVPPNEPSRKFHESFGFHEAGRQWRENDSKQVSLQVATVGQVGQRKLVWKTTNDWQ